MRKHYQVSERNIGSLCRKAGQKINALARLKNYLASDQKNLQLNSVIKSQFTYCTLVWMFKSRDLNNTLNNIHERALRLIYDDQQEQFNSIFLLNRLRENNLKTISQKNLEFLAVEHTNFRMPCLRQSLMIFSCPDETFVISKSFRNFPPQLKTL